MTNVCRCFEQNRFARKHVYRAVFLHITPIFDNDGTPVASQGRARANVYIFANNDIARNDSLRMYKRARVHNRNKPFKSIDHNCKSKQALNKLDNIIHY